MTRKQYSRPRCWVVFWGVLCLARTASAQPESAASRNVTAAPDAPAGANSARANSTTANSADANSANANSANANSAPANSADVNSTNANSADVNSAEANSAEANSAEANSAEANSAEANSADEASVAGSGAQVADADDLLHALGALVGRPGGLTAEQVARKAVSTSPALAASAERARATQSDVRKAKLDDWPRLNLIGRYTRLSSIEEPVLGNVVVAPGEPVGPLAPGATLFNAPFSFPTVLNQYWLQANVTVPLSRYLFQSADARSAAHLSRDAAELSQRQSATGTAGGAKVLYYDWVGARLKQVVVESAVTQAERHLATVKIAESQARATRADELSADSRLAQAELAAETARTQVERLERQLRIVMHDASGEHYEIGEVLELAAPPGPRENVETLLERAARNRADLRSVAASASALERRARLARTSALPRLNAFANAYYANPNPRFFPPEDRFHASWDAGLELTWSPNDWAGSDSNADELSARAAELRAERRAAWDRIQGEVLDAHRAARLAQAGYAAREHSWRSAEEAYRNRVLLFEYGRATSTEVLDAQTELVNARFLLIDAIVAARIAAARLESAVGEGP